MNPSLHSERRLQILTVSSEEATAALLEGVLSPAGYHLLHAPTAEEAIEQAIVERPNAILVEFPLPGCLNLEAECDVCLALCSLARPVLVIGMEADPVRAARAFEAGCSDYLVKPLVAVEVLARLQRHLWVEAALREQNDRIERIARVDTAADRSVDGAVHDLSNSLLSIRGLAELLVQRFASRSDPEALEIGEAIIAASRQGLTRVETALESTAPASEQAVWQQGPYEVRKLLDEAIGTLRGWASRKEIKLRLVEVKPGLVLFCDGKRLIRAVENLLSNAIKYSPQGTLVEVEAGETEEGLAIAVRDEGPGFTASDREHFFDDFRRASARPTGGEPSTGRGLALCREVVVAHQGRIECRNLRPHGSEFTINLPFRKDAA